MDAETLIITFVIFMTVAVLVAYAATRLRIPYTIAVVLFRTKSSPQGLERVTCPWISR